MRKFDTLFAMENSTAKFNLPRVLAWEVTRRCPLHCRHCRAGAADVAYARELETAECLKVIDSLAAAEPKPMIIWTGGEPMLRPDILELVAHATAGGIRSVMAPCGLLVTEERLRALKDAGVMACSFSLDGPDAASHDAFRGVPGAFDNVTKAMRIAHAIGMPFQVNTTVSTLNVGRLKEIHALAVELGASKLDLFFLVPVGRGKAIADYALSDDETKAVLDWAFEQAVKGPLAIKETCCPMAPGYWVKWCEAHAEELSTAQRAGRPLSQCESQRAGRPLSQCESQRAGRPLSQCESQRAGRPLSQCGARPCGCLGGRGFAFLSHVGELQTCGFIDVPCGNIRDYDLDFQALVASAANPLGSCGTCRAR